MNPVPYFNLKENHMGPDPSTNFLPEILTFLGFGFLIFIAILGILGFGGSMVFDDLEKFEEDNPGVIKLGQE